MTLPASPGPASTTPDLSTREELTGHLKALAAAQGFCLAGVAPAVAPDGFGSFQEWLKAGFAGEMHYLPRREKAYEHPSSVLPTVRSVLMLAMTFRTEDRAPNRPGAGQVSCYAWGNADYHDLLRERMRPLSDALHAARPGCRTRLAVDTAPLLERDFARRSGLGWFGKNTMLLNRRHGSFFFLSAILTDVDLAPDAPHETAHCGTCTRCLDACPTGAFPEPYVLDARKCISYLTIELKDDPVPVPLREGMGDWIFGCDICQEVCPWNRKAPRSAEPVFAPRDGMRPIELTRLLALSEEEFAREFGHTPLARPGRRGIARNAAIALGNQKDIAAVSQLKRSLSDPEPLVREAAAWALAQMEGTAETMGDASPAISPAVHPLDGGR